MELDATKSCFHIFKPKFIVFKSKPVKRGLNSVTSYLSQYIRLMHDHCIYIIT